MEPNGRTPQQEERASLLANNGPKEPGPQVHPDGEEATPEKTEESGSPPVLVIPPDGGYGWVIVAASFFANMMVDGIAYAYGILLVELVAYFEESKAKVSLVGSLLCGVYLCTGPIAAAFVQLYGCRAVTMVGAVISFAALVLSTFAQNVETLIFTYGVLGGFGFGLVYLPSTIIVNLYFEKRRSLAVGIAVCGSGVGAFVFAPFMAGLMEIYDWKNTMLILAGLMLNCLVFGVLYRPLSTPEESPNADVDSAMGSAGVLASLRRRIGSVGSDKASTGGVSTEERTRQRSGDVERASQPGGTGPVGEADLLRYVQSMDEDKTGGTNTPDRFSTSISSHRMRTQSECRSGTPNARRTTDTDVSPRTTTQRHSDAPTAALIHSTPNLGAKKSLVGRQSLRAHERTVALPRTANPQEYTKPMNRKDIFYSGSVFQMNRLGSMAQDTPAPNDYYRSMNIAASNQMIGSWIMSMTRLPPPDEETEDGRRTCWQRLPKSLRDVISQMTDFSLLTKAPYLFTWLGNAFFMIGYYVPFFLMVDFAAVHNGVPEGQASLLLSVIGITNTIGRVFFGWLVGLPCVSPLLVNNLTIFFSGVVTVFVPFCTVYSTMMLYAVLYGLLVAPVISLTSQILCDMFGIDKLTNAFGLLTLARGLSSSAGPPFAGFLFDATKRFDVPYYASGGVIIASALLFFLLHLPRFQRQMRENQQEMEGQQLAVIAASTSALNQDEPQTSV